MNTFALKSSSWNWQPLTCRFSLYHKERQTCLRHVLGLIPETAATLIGHHRQGILSMHLRLCHPTRCGSIYLSKSTKIVKNHVSSSLTILMCYLFCKFLPAFLQLFCPIQVLLIGGTPPGVLDCWLVQQPLPLHLPYLFLCFECWHKQQTQTHTNTEN